MNDAEKFELAKAGLKFCPECGKPLEEHPCNVWIMACFLHGDFRILWVDGALQVQWVASRMVRAYVKENIRQTVQEQITLSTAPAEYFNGVLGKIHKAAQQTRVLAMVALQYSEQEVTFLEAAQIIAHVETGSFPAEPNEAQRRHARMVLDHFTSAIESPRKD